MSAYSTVNNEESRRASAIAGLGSLVVACALGIAALGCNANRAAMEPTPDAPPVSAAPDTLVPDAAAEEPPVVVRQKPDTTLGEQLGRLDAQMRVASPDSLPMLQEEYNRLLALAAGSTPIQTGQEPTLETPTEFDSLETPTDAEPEDGTVPAEQRRTERSYVGPNGLLGFRKSELAATGTKAAKMRTRDPKARNIRPAPAPTPAEDAPSARTGERQYLDGLTNARAGRYEQAAKELPAVVANPPAGKRGIAQYSYAESLEKTGDLDKAAEQYRQASRGNDELSHKSYIAYCRTLARTGQRDKARQLLASFISRNPRSPQAVNARLLLQTL